MIELKSINEILQMDLNIPNFQRPYKWQKRNVEELLEDISNAIKDSKKYENLKYRIGTIIIQTNYGKVDIIDGQQRMLTLAILKYFLDNNFSCSLLELNINNKVSQHNIACNYACIKNWFVMKDRSLKDSFINIMNDGLEAVVITVNKLSSAFQLFDSQNTRGKELEPHDLLKAYHLREMREEPYEMYHAVSKWESYESQKISRLFDVYLFPILSWSKKEKTCSFSTDCIDYYKGIPENSNYTYARRVRKSSPYFQITELFTSGKDFFEMVNHYLLLLEDIEKELNNNKSFGVIKNIIDSDENIGFRYCVDLFKCALLCYYDKFHNFDEQAIKKLFVWALMLRIDMESLGFDSVNKYAIGGDNYNNRYTNNIAMFQKIINARYHNDIANLIISTKRENDKAKVDKWTNLYQKLININEGKE